jgi:catechol 2,3-dioxygenase-like lactoylglutathione lyase family enzyme
VAPSIAIAAVVETAIYVDDLDATEAFYRDVLGLEVIGKEAGHHVFFRVGDGVLLAFVPDATLMGGGLPPHGSRGPGHFALGVRAEALDHWRFRLEGLGVVVEKEVTWPRGGRSFYFRDPAANLVELITPGVWGLPGGW